MTDLVTAARRLLARRERPDPETEELREAFYALPILTWEDAGRAETYCSFANFDKLAWSASVDRTGEWRISEGMRFIADGKCDPPNDDEKLYDIELPKREVEKQLRDRGVVFRVRTK